jgi:hypothetical protein
MKWYPRYPGTLRDRFVDRAEAVYHSHIRRAKPMGGITEIWMDEMVEYYPSDLEFRRNLNFEYTEHHSRGVANRRHILRATTNLKGVGCNAEGY